MLSTFSQGVKLQSAGRTGGRVHVDSQSDFERLVTRHRYRADRSGDAFSLVVLTVDAGKRALVRLGRIARQRARVTDDVCYMSSFAVCVMLEGARRRGADRYVADVMSMAGSAGGRPRVDILTYGDGSHGDHSFGLDRSDWQRPGRMADRDGDDDLVERPTNSVKSLLARPMPAWKRVVDVLGAGAGIILAAPVMLAVAALIKVTSPGPVLFMQGRAGLGGRPFTMVKFRTMVTDAEALKHNLRRESEQDGPAFKMSNDPRVTRVGRFLRKTSLDELPQLFNVLRGEMSLVGPRPLPVDESDGCEQWHQHRLDVTPGITCTWQAEARSRVSFDDWMRMDLAYIRRLSFLRDLTIILKTVPSVLRRRGAV